jgi:hypothetical protein
MLALVLTLLYCLGLLLCTNLLPTETYQDRKNRPNVKRVVVITAVPVFMTNGVSINHTRDGIIAGLSSAIASGKFLSMAQDSI